MVVCGIGRVEHETVVCCVVGHASGQVGRDVHHGQYIAGIHISRASERADGYRAAAFGCKGGLGGYGRRVIGAGDGEGDGVVRGIGAIGHTVIHHDNRSRARCQRVVGGIAWIEHKAL